MNYTVVVDLGFGDAGKGRVVDFLCRVNRGALVVRYNGGPQAAHNVVTPGGRHHTFSQWGAGTFADSPTYLSKFMMVNPHNAFKEAEHLAEVGIHDPFSLLTVDARCMVLTPFHRALNRLREMSRNVRHGSTGEGIGEGRIYQSSRGWERVLRVGHLADGVMMRQGLSELHEYAREIAGKFEMPEKINERWGESMEVILNPKLVEWIEAYHEYARVITITEEHPLRFFRDYDDIIFEGAQGVLLDESFGFHPHTTWSKTTAGNALELINGTGSKNITVLGVMRSYTTRHGDGPMVTEDFHLTRDIPELHNGTGVWQGAWRNGHLDLPALAYATSVSTIDALVVTHMDRVPKDGWEICTSYDTPSTVTRPRTGDYYLQGRDSGRLMKDYLPVLTNVSKSAYLDMIEHHLNRPVVMECHGPTAHETRVLDRAYINPTNRRNNAELAQATS